MTRCLSMLLAILPAGCVREEPIECDDKDIAHALQCVANEPPATTSTGGAEETDPDTDSGTATDATGTSTSSTGGSSTGTTTGD